MPSRRLLIADDYRTGREALADLLREEDFTVLTTAYRSLALAQILDFDPQVAVLAVASNEEVGRRTIAGIRRRLPLCSVVCVASSAELSMARAMLDAGAVAYLPKPLRFSHLLIALRPLIARRSA